MSCGQTPYPVPGPLTGGGGGSPLSHVEFKNRFPVAISEISMLISRQSRVTCRIQRMAHVMSLIYLPMLICFTDASRI